MNLKDALKIRITTPTKKTWVYVLRMLLWTTSIGLTAGFFLNFGDNAVYFSLIPIFFIFRELVRNYILFFLSLLKKEKDV